MPCFSVWRERRCQCSVHLSLITADMLAVQCQKHLFSTRKKNKSLCTTVSCLVIDRYRDTFDQIGVSEVIIVTSC